MSPNDVHQALDELDLSEDGVFVAQRTRYIWIDEDNKRMGPIHAGIGEALNFLKRYPMAYEQFTTQLEQRLLELDERDSHHYYHKKQVLRTIHALEKMSLTTKPPARLRRVVARTTIEGISEAEQSIIDDIAAEVGTLHGFGKALSDAKADSRLIGSSDD